MARDPWWCRLAVLAAVAYAASALVVATRQGPGISPDSVAYASTALNLAGNGHLTSFDGQRLSIFPPGLPLLLAGFDWIGVGVETSAVVLSVVSAVVVVLGTRCLARTAGLSPTLAALASLFVATNLGLVAVNAMLWSEPLFCAATAVALVALQRIHQRRALTTGPLIVLTAAAGVAQLLRFTGVVLVPITGLIVVVAFRSRGPAAALVRAAGAAALTALGAVVVATLNVLSGNAAAGTRSRTSFYNPLELLEQLVQTVGGYLTDDLTPPTARIVIGALLLVLLGAGLTLSLRGGWRRVLDAPALLIVVFTAGYVGFLILSELVTVLNPIEKRLLAPAFAPLVVCVLLAVQTLSRHLAVASRARAVGGLASLVVVALLAVATGSWAVDAGRLGLRYNAVALRAAPWIEAVDVLPLGVPVISNDPYGVRWLTGREPVLPAPGIGYYFPVSFEDRVEQVAASVRASPRAYLVLFGFDDQGVVAALRHAGLDVTPARRFQGDEPVTIYRLALAHLEPRV
ncbi:MAG: hypothetical protein ACR2KL_08460 [Nocardioidaceae bacterium]